MTAAAPAWREMVGEGVNPFAPLPATWEARTAELARLLGSFGPDLGYQARLLEAARTPGCVLLALPEIGLGLGVMAWALDDIAKDPRIEVAVGDTLVRRYFEVQRAQAVAVAVARLCAEADQIARGAA